MYKSLLIIHCDLKLWESIITISFNTYVWLGQDIFSQRMKSFVYRNSCTSSYSNFNCTGYKLEKFQMFTNKKMDKQIHTIEFVVSKFVVSKQ